MLKSKNRDGVLVLGASGSIGQAIIQNLLGKECNPVIGTYNSVLPDIPGVQWVKLNLYDAEDLENLYKIVRDQKLDAMIYAIGLPSSKKTIVETSIEEWHRLFFTNCIGFPLVYTTLSHVLRRFNSRVVVLSSSTTRKVGPNNGVYTASKQALEAVVKTLAKEEAQYGVKINAIAPSLVDSRLAQHIMELKRVTDYDAYKTQLPWGKMIDASDIADVVVALALDKSWEYVTGQIIHFSAQIN